MTDKPTPEAPKTIQERINELICDEFGVEEHEVTPKSHFTNDLGADSLDVVELAMRVEEEFGLDIPDEELYKIQTVQELYTYVERRKK